MKANVVCVIDCCYSGGAIEGAPSHLGDKQNVALFASCAPSQESYFTEDCEQSRFTSFLIAALTGRIPSALSGREVTTHSLRSCVANEFATDAQQPLCWVGETSIVLATPVKAKLVSTSPDEDLVRELFACQITEQIAEYGYNPEVSSSEFHIYSNCYHRYFRGHEPASNRELLEQRASTALATWADTPGSPLLLLMGDTGTGKTTTIKRFWYEQATKWLSDRSRPIPFLLDLKAFGGIRLLEGGFQGDANAHVGPEAVDRFRAVVCDLLQNTEGLPLFWQDFEALCRAGRFLLIFDGLDEMDIEGAKGTAAANLGLLLKLLPPSGKMIVSCRSHYLRTAEELRGPILAWARNPFEVEELELRHFTSTQINAFLRARISPELLERWQALTQTDSLELLQLAKIPFLLAELWPHIEDVIEDDVIHPARLFKYYLNTWLKRDEWRFNRFFNDFSDAIVQERAQFDQLVREDTWVSGLTDWKHIVVVQFMEFVATHLWARDRLEIDADEIQSVIRSHLPMSPDIFIAFFDYVIRTCSFFHRRGRVYAFVHPAVREYLAARKFHGDILREVYPWDHSHPRGTRPIPRVPLELGLRPLTARMADILADTLRAEANWKNRLKEIIETTPDRVRRSPETLYYLAGNCLSLYARLNRNAIRGSGPLDLQNKWLNGALLEGCDLSGINLTGSLFDGANLQNADLSKTKMYDIQIHRSAMTGANLTGVEINGGPTATLSEIVGFDVLGAPPALQNVYRLSNGKRASRVFVRPAKNVGDMVRIPAGAFDFGTNSPGAEAHEKPSVRVLVDAFDLDRRPVTNGEFAEFLESNPEWRKEAVSDRYGIPYYLSYWRDGAPPPAIEDHPVVYVSWYSAEAYAAWMGKRLPTEVEWEFALRDALHENRWDYPLGAHPGTGVSELIRQQSQGASGSELRTLGVLDAEAGKRQSAHYGLIDMSGNVNEWVSDWFCEDLNYRVPLVKRLADSGEASLANYRGPVAGSRKVIRGGSFLHQPDPNWTSFTTYCRRPLPPVNTNQDCGFRCAKSVR